MGMAASQARLLTITTRLSDNELHSQMLTNTKLDLAKASKLAGLEFNNALSAQSLYYNEYNENGTLDRDRLTAANLTAFGDFKNQYVISNAAGQVLVNSKDKANFENSVDLESFILNYMSKTPNKAYEKQLNLIYGKNYSQLFNADDIYDKYNKIVGDAIGGGVSLQSILNSIITKNDDDNFSIISFQPSGANKYDENGIYNISTDKYNEIRKTFKDFITNNLSPEKISDEKDFYSTLINFVSDIPKVPDAMQKPVKPTYGPEPRQEDYQMPDPNRYYDSKLTNAFGNCFDVATGTFKGPYNKEYLGMFLNPSTTYITSDGHSFTTGSNASMNLFDTSDSELRSINHASKQSFRDDFWPEQAPDGGLTELQQTVIDVYYQLDQLNKMMSWSGQPEVDSIKIPKTQKDLTHDKEYFEQATDWLNRKPNDTMIKERYDIAKANYENKDFYIIDKDSFLGYKNNSLIHYSGGSGDELLKYVKDKISNDVVENYRIYRQINDVNAFQTAHTEWENKKLELDTKYEAEKQKYNANVEKIINDFKKDIINFYNNFQLYTEQYKAELDILSGIEPEILDENNPKYSWYKNLYYRMGGDDDANYKELSGAKFKDADWFQFALEEGSVILEQLVFSSSQSKDYPELGHRDWQTLSYKSSLDIQSAENEQKQVDAQAKYTKTLNQIEAKDKMIDQTLKQLDTEHNALQTHYDSVMNVISKNTERTFKMYS